MTPFGSYCRHLRFHNSVSLKTQATALSVSPSYLSSLENGKRGKPSRDIIQKISNLYSLNSEEVRELKQAARDSSTTVKIPQTADIQFYRIVNRMMECAAVLSKTERDIIELILDSKHEPEDKSMKT